MPSRGIILTAYLLLFFILEYLKIAVWLIVISFDGSAVFTESNRYPSGRESPAAGLVLELLNLLEFYLVSWLSLFGAFSIDLAGRCASRVLFWPREEVSIERAWTITRLWACVDLVEPEKARDCASVDMCLSLRGARRFKTRIASYTRLVKVLTSFEAIFKEMLLV